MEPTKKRSKRTNVKKKTNFRKSQATIEENIIYLKNIKEVNVLREINIVLSDEKFLNQIEYFQLLNYYRETLRPKSGVENETEGDSYFNTIALCFWRDCISKFEECYNPKIDSDVNSLNLRASWRESVMSDIEFSFSFHEKESNSDGTMWPKGFERQSLLNEMWLMALERNPDNEETATSSQPNKLDIFTFLIITIAKGVLSTLISSLSTTTANAVTIPEGNASVTVDSRLIQLAGAAIKGIHGVMKNLLRRRTSNFRTEARNHLIIIRYLTMSQSEKKTNLPSSLQLKDKGYLFFMKKLFYPFLLMVDLKIKEHLQKENLTLLGSKIAAVSCPVIKQDRDLKMEFLKVAEVLTQKNPYCESFYKLLISKMVNARFKDFMFASFSEKIPKGGFLLRDKLGLISKLRVRPSTKQNFNSTALKNDQETTCQSFNSILSPRSINQPEVKSNPKKKTKSKVEKKAIKLPNSSPKTRAKSSHKTNAKSSPKRKGKEENRRSKTSQQSNSKYAANLTVPKKLYFI